MCVVLVMDGGDGRPRHLGKYVFLRASSPAISSQSSDTLLTFPHNPNLKIQHNEASFDLCGRNF